MITLVNTKPLTNAYYPMRWEWSKDPFPAFRAWAHRTPFLMPFASGMEFGFPDREAAVEIYRELNGTLNSLLYSQSEGWPGNFDATAPPGVGAIIKELRSEGSYYPNKGDLERTALLRYCFGPNTWRAPDGRSTDESIQQDGKPCKVIKTKKGTDLIVPCPAGEDENIVLFQGLGGFRGGIGETGVHNGDIIKSIRTNGHCVPVWTGVARIKEGGYIWFDTGRRAYSGRVTRIDGHGRITVMTREEHDVERELR